MVHGVEMENRRFRPCIIKGAEIAMKEEGLSPISLVITRGISYRMVAAVRPG